jgi:hypothetical protein
VQIETYRATPTSFEGDSVVALEIMG